MDGSLQAPQQNMAAGTPDRLIMVLQGLDANEAERLAQEAVSRARVVMPRVTGATANSLRPLSGEGYFGITFPEVAWWQEHGTKPRTMKNLAGKTIPMWVEDPDGSERRKNPHIKTRTTQDGRFQVQIFRKSSPIGARRPDGKAASYPGAPGRIGTRGPMGRIGAGNVGVRWRHPGLRSLQFMNGAMATAAFEAGHLIDPIFVLDASNWESFRESRGLI